MDQLALHIEYLLRRNDCVILPGVGAFISVHIPARFDKETAMWHPMSQEIRFNQAVNQDDGLLANSYARKYSLPFHEARQLLDADIRSMLHLIGQDGEVSVGRIGMLSAGEAGALIFQPLRSLSCSGKEIGMVPVASCPQHISTSAKGKPREGISQIAENYAEVTSGKFDTRKNYYIAVNKVFAKVACSFIAICMIAAVVALNTDLRIGEDKASVLPVEEIVDTTTSLAKKAKTTSMKVESEVEIVDATPGNIEEIAPGNTDDAIGSRKKRFHLVVGTFRSEAEANQYTASVGTGSAKFEIIPSKTLWRVSLASSDDKSELIKILNSPEVSKVYEGAWIFEDKSAF